MCVLNVPTPPNFSVTHTWKTSARHAIADDDESISLGSTRPNCSVRTFSFRAK